MVDTGVLTMHCFFTTGGHKLVSNQDKEAETLGTRTLLFLPFLRHSACFPREASQFICKVKSWSRYTLGLIAQETVAEK